MSGIRRAATTVVAGAVAAGAVVAGAVLGAGCTSDPALSAASSTAVEPQDPGDAAATFFGALASATAADDREAIDASKDGTVARDYAVVLNAIHAAEAANGILEDATIEVDGDEIRRCSKAVNDCTVFADIEVEGDQVTDFTVNGDDPSGRVVAGGDPVTVAGITYRPVGAYLSITITGYLLVPYEITNGSTAAFEVDALGGTYVDATGRRLSPVDVAGPTAPLRPGATGTVVAVFEGASLGGHLAVNGFLDEGTDDGAASEASARLEIPSPAA